VFFEIVFVISIRHYAENYRVFENYFDGS